MKDLKRSFSHTAEWRRWERARAEIKDLCIEAAPLSFADEDEAISHVQQVIHKESAIGIQYVQPKENEPHKDDRATKRRRKEDPHYKG